MAKNISPLISHESEVQGLVAWSILPTQLLFWFGNLICLEQLGMGLYFLFLKPNTLIAIWHLALSLSFLSIALQVRMVFVHSKQYLIAEDRTVLGKLLTHLGGFWVLYQFALGLSLVPLMLCLIRNVTGWDYQELELKPLLSMIAALFFLGGILFFWNQKRSENTQPTLSQCAETFANQNIRRTRALTFFSIGIGILWVGAYLGDALLNTYLDKASFAFLGAAYLLIGAATGFVWRSVREIQRNPSLIYFERALEKLNLFWLSTCVAFATILAGSFF